MFKGYLALDLIIKLDLGFNASLYSTNNVLLALLYETDLYVR
jgi:hypothetical protein